MTRSTVLGLAGVVVLSACGRTEAAWIIDQQNPDTFGGGGFNISSGLEWQQEVVVGVSGQLVGVDLWPSARAGHPANFSADLSINRGAGWQTDANDFATDISGVARDDWFFIDLSSANLFFNAGETFTIGLTADLGEAGMGEGGSGAPGYTAGRLFLNGSEQNSSSFRDFAFRTHVEPTSTSVVPEPGSLALMSFGGLGLLSASFGRRRLSH